VQFIDHFGLIGKTLIQGSTLRNRFARFIFHELLPLTQTPQKSAPNLYSPATTSDCTRFDAPLFRLGLILARKQCHRLADSVPLL
jgi:hypothetical protein